MRSDVSDIGGPERVRRIHVKLPVQGIVRHDCWAATIGARPFFRTNLGLYARQSRKTPNPVRACLFAKIAQIIVQLAVAIDLVSVIAGQFHQLGLTLIFQCPLRNGFAQPCIKTARVNHQHPAHGPYRKHQPVLSNERIPHRDSLAKYAVAFFKMSPFAGKTVSQTVFLSGSNP